MEACCKVFNKCRGMPLRWVVGSGEGGENVVQLDGVSPHKPGGWSPKHHLLICDGVWEV